MDNDDLVVTLNKKTDDHSLCAQYPNILSTVLKRDCSFRPIIKRIASWLCLLYMALGDRHRGVEDSVGKIGRRLHNEVMMGRTQRTEND